MTLPDRLKRLVEPINILYKDGTSEKAFIISSELTDTLIQCVEALDKIRQPGQCTAHPQNLGYWQLFQQNMHTHQNKLGKSGLIETAQRAIDALEDEVKEMEGK